MSVREAQERQLRMLIFEHVAVEPVRTLFFDGRPTGHDYWGRCDCKLAGRIRALRERMEYPRKARRAR